MLAGHAHPHAALRQEFCTNICESMLVGFQLVVHRLRQKSLCEMSEFRVCSFAIVGFS